MSILLRLLPLIIGAGVLGRLIALFARASHHPEGTAMSGYEQLLSFDRDSVDFARGVEVGMTWARLVTEQRPVTALARWDNAEMILRLAEAHSVRATAVDLGGDWLEVTFAPDYREEWKP